MSVPTDTALIPKIRCARKELLNTTITLDINELKQCKDYKSMEDNNDDFLRSKNALTVKQNGDNIEHDYSVCASSTSARLGIKTYRTDSSNKEIKCEHHDDCCKRENPSDPCAPGALDFCDKTTKQCKLATITSFSNCMKVKLNLNTKFNLWTGKAGTNPQTGVMSTMRVIDMKQKYDPTQGEKGDTHAKVVMTYEIQSKIKVHDQAGPDKGKPAHVIGVRGVSNVQPKQGPVGADLTNDFLEIKSVSVNDVEYVDTGDRISRTIIVAETRWFKVKDANGFYPDAMSKHSTNFGLDVNVFNCKVDKNNLQSGVWKFPTNSIEGTCSDAGYESFPASVEWKFTKFDASKDLTIDTKMLKFKSWMPAMGSKYFDNMQGRKDWWSANRLGDNVKQLQPTDALVLSLGTTNYAEGLSSYIKTVTLIRSVKQIVHTGSSQSRPWL